MTLPRDALEKARDSLLLSIKDPQVEASLLMDIIDRIDKQTPDLFESFQSNNSMKTSNSDQIEWSSDYFSRQCWLTRENFARERIEHLVQIKDYLRKQGVKGFIPTPKGLSTPHEKSDCKVNFNFTPSENLKKFVTEGDPLTIRTALRMELYNNRLSTSELKATISWAKSRVPNLFEVFAEKSFARGFDLDHTNWTSEYFDTQIVYLKTNFSEERLLHLIEVREQLSQQGVDGFIALPPKANSDTRPPAGRTQANGESYQPQNTESLHSSPELNPIFKTAVLIGGAVAVLVVLLITLTR